MPALLPVFVTGSYLLLAADGVPKFNIDASCRAAAASSAVVNRSFDVCKKDEQGAHAKLEQQWGQYAPVDKARCAALARTGGSPSYVEILTCLEMAEAARKLPTDHELPGGMPKK